MPGANTFLGRQPIVDRRERVVANELLFRSEAHRDRAVVEDLDHASLTALVNTFALLGVPAVLGPCRGFFNVTGHVLESELIEFLPRDRVVLEILETEKADASLISRCRELKRLGFSLALDDVVPDDPREALLPLVDVVKVDIPAFTRTQLRTTVRALRGGGRELLAEKVETQDELARCQELGFDLFQGFYFARPVLLQGHSADQRQLGLLRVLELIQRDAENHEIAEELKPQPGVSMALMRLTNSVIHGRAQRVARIEDAVVYLGRRQLERWLTVLLFLGRTGGVRNPLLATAVHRARLMEILAVRMEAAQPGADLGDRAFLVGMLSLVDALLGRPKEEVLAELNLEESSRRAVLEQEGLLGDLLRLTIAFQEGRFPEVEERLEGLGISVSVFQDADQEAFAWQTTLLQDLQGTA